MKSITLIVASLGLCLPVLASASVFRCTNARGTVTYQSNPCVQDDASRQVEIGPRNGPTASPVVDRLKSPERENEGAHGSADAMTWGAQSDTLVVSAYEFSASTTKVAVDHPARPVLLVLSSYRATHWQVQVQPGTRLRAIVVGAQDGSSTVSAPPQVPVVTDPIGYAHDVDNAKFRSLIRRLNSRYGVTKVMALNGSYRLPETIILRGPFVPDPRLTIQGVQAQPTSIKMDFELPSADGRLLPWSNTGPRGGKTFTGLVRGGGLRAWSKGAPAVVRNDGAEAYELTGNGGTLMWFPKGLSGPKQKVDVPASLPPLSWASALAWDQAKGLLSLVSFGGEGYFYRYDTRRREWLGATSLRDRDLTGLAVDPRSGRCVGVSIAAELLVFNERGEIDEVLPLRDQLLDLNSVYDRGNERLESLSVPSKAISSASSTSATTRSLTSGPTTSTLARRSSPTGRQTFEDVGHFKRSVTLEMIDAHHGWRQTAPFQPASQEKTMTQVHRAPLLVSGRVSVPRS